MCSSACFQASAAPLPKKFRLEGKKCTFWPSSTNSYSCYPFVLFFVLFCLKKLKLKSGQTFCAVDTTPTNLKFGLSVFDSFT
jgi:hypothetical protein